MITEDSTNLGKHIPQNGTSRIIYKSSKVAIWARGISNQDANVCPYLV